MGPVLGGSWGTGTALWAGGDTSDMVWLVHVVEQVQEAVPKYLEAFPVFLCGIESCRFCSTAQQEQCWDILDYSHMEVVHSNNSSLLMSHHSLNNLSDYSTSLGTKLP